MEYNFSKHSISYPNNFLDTVNEQIVDVDVNLPDYCPDIEKILKSGKHVMTTMDICGAMSLKTNFKNVITIYIKREKKALLNSILRKNSTIKDKINRIIGIDAEKQNSEICDYIVEFDNYDDAINQICKILKISK